MAKHERKVVVAVLNVVMPEPHGPARYVELFRAAYKTRRAIKIRGEFAAILGSFGRLDGQYVEGEVYKFFDLQLEGKWLNLRQRAPAEIDELADLVVPDHLKPGLENFNFLFHPQRHRLFIVSRERKEHFAPGDLVRYFRQLLNQPVLQQHFGEINVVAEPDADSLERIFGMPTLRRLEIEISPPNPDDIEELEKEIKERLRNQNAKRMEVTLVADRGDTLQPDEETRALAEVAQSNGKVNGHGVNEEGNTVAVSTVNHPHLSVAHYDPDVDTATAALHSAADAFLRNKQRRAQRRNPPR